MAKNMFSDSNGNRNNMAYITEIKRIQLNIRM